jgi:hypothetical protein
MDSLRVRWVPVYCFPTLSLRPFAGYVAFLRSDYYGLFDCLEGLGDFGPGLPCLLPTLLPIPFRLSRVPPGGLKQDDVGGVLLAAPSALCGSPVPAQGKQVHLCLLPHGDGNFHVSDLTSQTSIGFRACLAGIIGKVCRVSVPRRAMHASCESPCHLSAKHHVLRTCLPLMTPFRAMLLTS